MTARKGQSLEVVAPAAFLPLRLARMPKFQPQMCVLASEGHAEWAKVTRLTLEPDVGSLTTDYRGDGHWSGRPLINLNHDGQVPFPYVIWQAPWRG